MSSDLTLWLLAVSFAASALGGVLGMASGIFIVAILTLFFRIDFHHAVGVSLVSVIACSCGGAASFLKAGLTNVRLALVLELATTLGALTGVLLIGVIPTPFLYGLFAVILILSAQQMVARRREAMASQVAPASGWGARLRLHSSITDPADGKPAPYHVGRVPLGLGLMYGAGLVSALLGVGSGVLKIPAMDSALRLPIKVSTATSNFMIGVTAAASAGAYYMRGDIDIGMAGPVALGSVLGALLGARLLMGMPAEKLRLFFVAVLGLLAIAMMLAAFGVRVV